MGFWIVLAVFSIIISTGFVGYFVWVCFDDISSDSFYFFLILGGPSALYSVIMNGPAIYFIIVVASFRSVYNTSSLALITIYFRKQLMGKNDSV